MKFGTKTTCKTDDRIDVELSPDDLGILTNLMAEKALEEHEYCTQGIYRKIKDYLQERWNTWLTERSAYDKTS